MPRQAKRNSAQPSPLLESSGDATDVAMDNNAIYATDATAGRMVADSSAEYNSAASNIDALIAQARADMERAAKSLDFMAAARYRDRMYELQQIKEEQLNTQY